MNGGRAWTRRAVLAGAVLTPLALAGCGGQPAAAGPPQIAFGRDTCAACGMIISDERFAAALTVEDIEPVLFDDVGEMLQTVAAEGLAGRRAWAHDRESVAWLDAMTATYVRGDAGTTPMGTGFSAFANRDAAAAFAAEQGGDVMAWDDAIRYVP
jgi:nitrous oxide reductase accessory protein NosL